MLNVHDEQFFKLQLKWAADNFDAEHRMRLAAEERAAGARGLLMDVVVHLLASELDDVRKKEDVALWTDAQLGALDERPVGPPSHAVALFDGRRGASAARTGRAGESAACRRRTRNSASRTC